MMRPSQKAYREEHVIGDFSRPCSLGTVPGRMYDILSISPATLAQLLTDNTQNVTVLDCRYPYEYEGGHIVGARNLYTKDLVKNEFLANKQPLTSVTSNREILVFHCEFSIERGPNMARFLREADRTLNKAAYPALHYPEIYLLHEGYKAFWEFSNENKNHLCEPSNYRPMVAEGFQEEMWKYRNSSKSRKHTKSPRFSRRTDAPRRLKRVLF
jgi:M-phase inducer phosphatase